MFQLNLTRCKKFATRYNDDDIEMNDTLTEQHAEDSIYVEDDDDEEDGKLDEEETPMGGPERKTSEGNDTMCWSLLIVI